MAVQSESSAKELYDLCLIIDGTASMSTYLVALQESLPQILALSALTSAFTSISVIAYRDYDRTSLQNCNVVEFSGWYDVAGKPDGEEQVDLLTFAREISISGGEDYPEASKTAIHTLLKNVHADRRTLCFWFTDAPPHSKSSRSWGGLREKEIAELNKDDIGKECLDWVSACRLMAKHKVQVMSVLDKSMGCQASWYVMLSSATNGVALSLSTNQARTISLASMDILMAWLGQKPRDKLEVGVMTLKYPASSEKKFRSLTTEDPKSNLGFLPKTDNDKTLGQSLESKPYDITKDVTHGRTAVLDFAVQFAADETYKKLVFQTLQTIIEFDVTTVSLNPVVGELWRVVCAERGSELRDRVVNAFAVAVGKMPVGELRESMKIWLEESYHQAKEIQRIIEVVPAVERYPAVCIDPTEAAVGAAHWIRADLLEISRSCQASVLKRLGKVLTKLVFVPSEADCPAHLRDDSIVEKIPFVLAKKEHKRSFWKILLHLVLPGTFLSARAGALLAALCLKIGVQIPGLQEAARETLVAFRGKWADLEVGENWSLECMRLLVYCDDKDRKDGKKGILTDFERELFKNLNDYKLAEFNLDTELIARIPFTPERTRGYIGPTIKCRECKYDRSVTIMAKNSLCGVCAFRDYPNKDIRQEAINTRAETEHGAKTIKHWFECGNQECRCAYVVYAIESLNVKPKCHYCRNPEDGKAPFIECKKCTNRVICPQEYQTASHADFLCVFCEEGRETIVAMETSARELNKENGVKWILGKNGEKIGFSGRSVFATVKAKGMDVMHDKIELFPNNDKIALTLRSKPVMNTENLIEDYKKWVSSNTIEYKTCNLCFDSSFKPADLHFACGRKGCQQKICTDCLKSWYGMNKPGSIVNLNSLHCPFCRRAPAAKVLRGYGLNISTLGGVQEAVSKRGEWIFGWCMDCDTAKQYMERVCTAGGQPPELVDFHCEECDEKRKPGQKAIKPCPKCGVMTQKTAGCNHITCKCGTHWCYVCGSEQESSTIYAHLQAEHGGFFFADDVDDDSDEDDYIDDNEYGPDY